MADGRGGGVADGDGVADGSGGGVADGSGGGVALLVGTGVALGLEGMVITRVALAWSPELPRPTIVRVPGAAEGDTVAVKRREPSDAVGTWAITAPL